MKRIGLFLYVVSLCAVLCGCAGRTGGKDAPALPEPENTLQAQAKASSSPGKAAELVP